QTLRAEGPGPEVAEMLDFIAKAGKRGIMRAAEAEDADEVTI
ncbi:MAG TPA: hypothetical protein DCM05_15970, partial [Elusimicrobia bacterium]|nr:hypothetical protein [Elusimicrobiota bacterium]